MTKLFLRNRINKYLKDLPNNKELSIKITNYVKQHKNYNLAQIGQIIDNFYNNSCGLSIAEDITILWK